MVDASVIAKWFNRGEEFEKESDKLRAAWVSDEVQLQAPSHLQFEVANSIWKSPSVPSRKASRLAKMLVNIAPKLHDLTEVMAVQAMLLARRSNITFYDVSYLTLAKRLSLRLITADDGQLRAASGYIRASHLSSLPGLL